MEVLVPGPYSRFYGSVQSDEIKCVAVLCAAETFLEGPYITLEIKQLQNNRELLSLSNYNFVCIE